MVPGFVFAFPTNGSLWPFCSVLLRLVCSCGSPAFEQPLHPVLCTALGCRKCRFEPELLFTPLPLCFLSSWKAFSTEDNFRFGIAAVLSLSGFHWMNQFRGCTHKSRSISCSSLHTHTQHTLFFFFWLPWPPQFLLI